MPERVLWAELRKLRDLGFHFRRQVPIGPYYADFICHRSKLAIEVDGHLHGSDVAQVHDRARTKVFRVEGYEVVRATNSDIMSNLEGVMELICTKLGIDEDTPTPNPSPQGGGEQG